MPDPASSSGPPPSNPPTVYITVDLSPTAQDEKVPLKGASQSTSAASPRRSALWEPPDPVDLAGVLPGYTILELLGSGGMGAVYRARQKSLDRLVALKVLSPELAERAPEFTERFNNEAGALAKLSHPSIVHLFDCGRTKDGQLYIAMELVSGRDVAERLAGKQPLPQEEALSIAITVCEALEHAHQRGVIHRDIKPANVMLDGAGRVKITDFGLARIIQAAVPKERQTTSLLGTPRFTAPEALVPGGAVDVRADIFSVGVMLYQMLTGEVPRGRAVPPSELVPGLDSRFDAIVVKAMSENPGDRHSDVARLRAELERIRTEPNLETLPAATRVNLKTADTKSPVPPSARTTQPAPRETSDHDEEELVREPPRRIPLMPWISTLVVVAIAGFWAWQQWKHPNDEVQASAPSSPAPDSQTIPAVTGNNSLGSPPPSPFESSPSAPVPAPSPMTGSSVPPAPGSSIVSEPASPLPSIPPAAAPATFSTASPEELAQTQRRVAQIQGDFDAAVKEWQSTQDLKFQQLKTQYLRAVRTAIITVRNERKHDQHAALQEEERLLTTGTPLPPLETFAPVERQRLRGIYDGQVRQIASAGAESKLEIYNRLLGSLFAYQSILRQTNKPGSVELVSGVLDKSVKERDALRASLTPAEGQEGEAATRP